MRHKRRVYYEVTHLSPADIWYCGRKRGWVKYEGRNGSVVCSSHCQRRTLDGAIRSALQLRERGANRVSITRYFYRNGKRLAQEFSLREKGGAA